MSKHVVCLIVLTLLASACGDSSAPAPTARPGSLYVDPERQLGEISPLVYGSNYGPWVAVPVEMMPATEQAGITVVRWPGGSWGDRNNLQPYQIDQFVAFCQQIGAEPSISVRLMEGTPEAAAELVRYANLEKGYGIRFWSIGNEPTLFADSCTNLTIPTLQPGMARHRRSHAGSRPGDPADRPGAAPVWA